MPSFHADEAEEQPGGGQREGHREAGEQEQQQAAEQQRHEVLGDEFHQRTSSWTCCGVFLDLAADFILGFGLRRGR
jgi:hypothetical protein